MGATDSIPDGVWGDSERRSPRVVAWTTAFVASALVLAIGALAIAQGDSDTAPAPSFWSYITPVVAEQEPGTVDEIASSADAIVVAHVVGIVAGRPQTGVFDPTPGVVAPPYSSYVQLSVDRVVAGGVAVGQTLNLEMVQPPHPITLDDVRKLIPPDQMLFFLDNSGARTRKAGLGSLMDPREDAIWTLDTQRGIVGASDSGLYEVLHPQDPDLTYVRSFTATTLDQAVTRTAQALH